MIRLLISIPILGIAALPIIGLIATALGLGVGDAADVLSRGALVEMLPHLARAGITAVIATLIAQIIGLCAAFGLTYRPFPLKPVFKPTLALLALAPVLVFSVPMLRGAWSLGLGDNLAALCVVYVLVLAPVAAWIHTWNLSQLPVKDLLALARLDGLWLGRSLRLVVLPRIGPGLWLSVLFCLAVPWIQIASFGILLNHGTDNLATLYAREGLIWARGFAPLAQGFLVIMSLVAIAAFLTRRHLLKGLRLAAADLLARWA